MTKSRQLAVCTLVWMLTGPVIAQGQSHGLAEADPVDPAVSDAYRVPRSSWEAWLHHDQGNGALKAYRPRTPELRLPPVHDSSFARRDSRLPDVNTDRSPSLDEREASRGSR